MDFKILPIHPEGWRFTAIFFILSMIFMALSKPLGCIGLILTAWCIYFFRNPSRVTPIGESLLVSPADGRVCLIQKVTPPASLDLGEDELTRVSVFLNVFDVHVNRVPLSGKVHKVLYHPGQFVNASFDKASDLNERNTVILDTTSGHRIGFIQIAGLIARRIRCDIQEGDSITKGACYGLIRFGSRMDIYLPKDVNPLVCIGQRMIAGETVVADFSRTYDPMDGYKN